MDKFCSLLTISLYCPLTVLGGRAAKRLTLIVGAVQRKTQPLTFNFINKVLELANVYLCVRPAQHEHIE